MSIADDLWFKQLKKQRLANIRARLYPKKQPQPPVRVPKELKALHYSAASQKRWSDPTFRAKQASHPWRQNYPSKHA